jgi:hypothetical protein
MTFNFVFEFIKFVEERVKKKGYSGKIKNPLRNCKRVGAEGHSASLTITDFNNTGYYVSKRVFGIKIRMMPGVRPRLIFTDLNLKPPSFIFP